MDKLISHNDSLDYLLNNCNSKTLHNSNILHGIKGIGKTLLANTLISKIFSISFKNSNNHHLNLFNNNTHPNIRILEKR